MEKICYFSMLVSIILVFTFFGAEPGPSRSEDPQITFSNVSPYIVAGKDGRFQVTISSASGAKLNSAMLDMSSFRIKLEDGKVLIPKREGIPKKKLTLGSHSSISRIVDLKDIVKVHKNQRVEVWWTYEKVKSDPVSLMLFEWELSDIEAVILTDFGEMIAEFNPDKAPGTVANFIDLSLKGFYDGLTFHRIIPGFMIQGGCPNGNGTGDPGYMIKAEFSDIQHVKGTLSMARSADPDSAGCQFFIVHGTSPHLDENYTAFGKLISGFEALDKITEVQVTNQRGGNEISRPVEPPVIKKITIRTKSKK